MKGGGAGKKGGEEKEWSGVEWYSLGECVGGSVEGLVGIAGCLIAGCRAHRFIQSK